MKLVFLMYLEGDDEAVADMLEKQGVTHWSRLSLEGHASGAAGWYGDVAPYRSQMIFSIMPADQAARIMDAVAACDQCEDPAHPIHAMQVDVERAATSGTMPLPAA